MSGSREERIAHRIGLCTGENFDGPLTIFTDTTDCMYIERGHVIELRAEFYLVRGHMTEGRFGLDDQPKFWVKRASALRDGRRRILKLVCRESFRVQIGDRSVSCARSGEKEAEVLRLVRGGRRFMQGDGMRDSRGNSVRAIDFISGIDLLSHIHSLNPSHERYFREKFPSLLAKTITAAKAIQFLDDNGLCHGDIRNDHILVERESGEFRWIDFDLAPDFPLFDLWSVGNILHCVVGKGFVTFRDALRERPELSGPLCDEDASVFFPHRAMNLRKVYPYIPEKLNHVLQRFSAGCRIGYDSAARCVDELRDCAHGLSLPAG